MPVLQTEFDFTLPKGFVDGNGTVHKTGRMRLANAADEILPLRDPRVKANPGYLTVIVLARVITQLGELQDINPSVVEGLFIEDFQHLQTLYAKVNGLDEGVGASNGGLGE